MSGDPVADVNVLGAEWAGNFDDYAAGRIDASQIECALCRHTPCDCPEFGSDAYFALLTAREGGPVNAGLRPHGDGYTLTVDAHEWTIRPAYPSGWDLGAPNGSAVAWADTVAGCVAYARGEGVAR